MKVFINIIIIIFLPFLIVLDCSAPIHFTKNEHSNIRRSQQMNSIDIGLPAEKGHALASLSYQFAAQEPMIQKYADTSLNEERIDILSTNSYESRHALAIDICIPFANNLSSGLLFEMYLGEINDNNLTKKKNISKNIFESSLYLRVVVPIGKFSIGYRPELLFYNVNGYATITYDTTVTNENDFHKISVTMRNSLFSRFNFRDKYSIFFGIQHKLQPFVKDDEKLILENAYGFYTGFGILLSPFIHINPYIGIPLITDYTNFRGPLQIGLKVVADISKKDKQNE